MQLFLDITRKEGEMKIPRPRLRQNFKKESKTEKCLGLGKEEKDPQRCSPALVELADCKAQDSPCDVIQQVSKEE